MPISAILTTCAELGVFALIIWGLLHEAKLAAWERRTVRKIGRAILRLIFGRRLARESAAQSARRRAQVVEIDRPKRNSTTRPA